jgi:hypothetical protein
MTQDQALSHLFQVALEAAMPAKVHSTSKEAFEILKKLIDEKRTAPKIVEKE